MLTLMTRRYFWQKLRYVGLVCLAAGLTIFAAPSPAQQQAALNPVLEVGVVQRFGEDPADEMTLKALSGDRITVEFETGGQRQTVTSDQIKILVGQQALPEARLQERVVLSSHRSFESAEDSANQWRQRGIETEIAQPDGWQVWAKRDLYSTPLLRRLLLKNLQAQGYDTVFLDSKIEPEIPKAAFIANGYRYNRDTFNITSGYQRVQVIEGSSGARQDTKLYAGSLRIQPNAYGTYTLVNYVPIETYLRGVVPHEIGLAAPMPTIEAQAVLARTYALRNLRRFQIDGYQLCADTQCQVYNGLGGAADKTDSAIANTRGLVLTYEDELIDALYSSTTGGVTAPFADVWNGPNRPYLRAVVDSVQNVWDLSQNSLADEQNFRAFISQEQGFNEEEWDLFRWRYDSDLEEIAEGLKQYLTRQQHPLRSFNKILQMQVTERAASGRVQKLDVQTDVGTVTLEKDEVIRALYPPRSLLFYLEPLYEASPQAASANSDPSNPQASPSPVIKGYAFVGGGFGHGVGMSQTGAYRLGALGWNYNRILQFYYPGTQLEPISEAIVFWRDPAWSAVSDDVDGAANGSETSDQGAAPSSSSAPDAPRLAGDGSEASRSSAVESSEANQDASERRGINFQLP